MTSLGMACAFYRHPELIQQKVQATKDIKHTQIIVQAAKALGCCNQKYYIVLNVYYL